MYRNIKYIVSIILVIALLSCKSKSSKSQYFEVHHSGALKTIISGNIATTIGLDSLQNIDHLFALGASENLKGEIQIFNGRPSNSFAVNDSIKINDSYDMDASLLVYAEVKEWNMFRIDNNQTKSELEAKIFELAKANNINIEKPFPFLLEGIVASLDWHVINWKDGDIVHSHKKHKESGLNGTLTNQEVVIIGFYSKKHKAVFTHHTTNMHMHFKTIENTLAGHVDDLHLTHKIILKLPRL